MRLADAPFVAGAGAGALPLVGHAFSLARGVVQP